MTYDERVVRLLDEIIDHSMVEMRDELLHNIQSRHLHMIFGA